ncbi:hypothetical protein H6F42_08320 [Pseudanabaena sp. FACHB-1998]|uniref:hypothetical protein n=1 Tax=Pseudanabaena sp. FACHB-1998 TaxID=2692858 RepID=UPI0016817BA4|nr:hypothetical protein [Pseudanabaena sp. FACHB-1998]MBD2176914.1 hypothetical protein [Pseudanabaena sp. FACHB-1998]
MDSSGSSVTACRLCQHYSPVGRMGGLCEKLDVHVKSKWEACSLAESPFEISCDTPNSLTSLLQDNLHDPLTISYHLETNELQYLSIRMLTLAEC